jgi:hypothetical protein
MHATRLLGEKVDLLGLMEGVNKVLIASSCTFCDIENFDFFPSLENVIFCLKWPEDTT